MSRTGTLAPLGCLSTLLPADGTEPADVAGQVLFLASDESAFITARELAPDARNTEF